MCTFRPTVLLTTTLYGARLVVTPELTVVIVRRQPKYWKGRGRIQSHDFIYSLYSD